MPKNKGRSRVKKQVENEFDDASMTSSGSVNSEVQETQALDVLIECLYGKSNSTRKIQGLQGLVSLLSSNVLQEDCVLRGCTLASMFSSIVRRGRQKEAMLAAHGLSLLLLTLGNNEMVLEIWKKTIQTELSGISLSGKSTEIKCSVLEVIALGCFVAEDDPYEIVSTMKIFKSLWSNGNSRVKSSAVKGWALNLSSLSSHSMNSLKLLEVAEELRLLLEEENLEVQEAAGIALVLLYNLNPDIEDYESDAESSTGSLSTTMSQVSRKDEAKDKLRDLSTARSERQKKSKKERAHTKATFREIYSLMEHGEFQEEKIKLQYGDVLVLSSLRMQIQMRFIRPLLGQGFHHHLHFNEFLHDVFDFKPHRSPSVKMSNSEKRFYKSPSSWSSKIRTRERDWNRAQKQVFLQGGY